MGVRSWMGCLLTAVVVALGLPLLAGADGLELEARGGVGHVEVWGDPSDEGTLVTVPIPGEEPVSGNIDRFGGLILDVPPGTYAIEATSGSDSQSLGPVTVTGGVGTVNAPPTNEYTQNLIDHSVRVSEDSPDRFGYLTTRDGSRLGFSIHLSPGITSDADHEWWSDEERYPVLIEDSVYASSDPYTAGDFAVDDNGFRSYFYPESSDMPASDPKFIVVGVNTRGTGCSSGALRSLWSDQEAIDGYDVVETFAAQPWVKAVGMIGDSYPAVTALDVARTNPPHLAAVVARVGPSDAYELAYPGGMPDEHWILDWNVQELLIAAPSTLDGTERAEWVAAMVSTSLPVELLEQAPLTWAHELIHDEAFGVEPTAEEPSTRVTPADVRAECEANQMLHGQAGSLVGDQIAHSTRDAYWSAASAIDRSQVPTAPILLIGAFQDRGELSANLFRQLQTARSTLTPIPTTRLLLHNGPHEVNFSTAARRESMDFLAINVADVLPSTSCDDRYAGITTVEAAAAKLGSLPPVFVAWEDGRVPTAFGNGCTPTYRYSSEYATWPPSQPNVGATGYTESDLYLGDGTLGGASLAAPSRTPYEHTPEPRINDYKRPLWKPAPDGESAIFTSEQLGSDEALLGPASLDLYVASTVDPIHPIDLEVSLSEVTLTGDELFVSMGRLRSTHRTVTSGTGSLEATPDHASLAADELSDDPLTPSRIEIPFTAFGHVFRAGSRYRVRVSAPGPLPDRRIDVDTALQNNLPSVDFEMGGSAAPGTVWIVHDVEHPSVLRLPRLPSAPGSSADFQPAPHNPEWDDIGTRPNCWGLTDAQPCLATGTWITATATDTPGEVRIDWDNRFPGGPDPLGYRVWWDDGCDDNLSSFPDDAVRVPPQAPGSTPDQLGLASGYSHRVFQNISGPGCGRVWVEGYGGPSSGLTSRKVQPGVGALEAPAPGPNQLSAVQRFAAPDRFGWKADLGGGLAPAVLDMYFNGDPAYSLSMQAETDGDIAAQTSGGVAALPAVEGEEFSGHVFGRTYFDARTVRTDIVFLDEEGAVVSVVPGTSGTESDEWTEYSATATAPADTAFVALRYTVFGAQHWSPTPDPNGGGPMLEYHYLENASLVATSRAGSPELLDQFTSGLDVAPWGWVNYGNEVEATLSPDDPPPVDERDKNVFLVTNPGANPTLTGNLGIVNTPVDEGATYSAAITAREFDGADGAVTALIIWIGPTGYMGASIADPVLLTDTWRTISVSASAPPGATQAFIGIHWLPHDGSSSYLFRNPMMCTGLGTCTG